MKKLKLFIYSLVILTYSGICIGETPVSVENATSTKQSDIFIKTKGGLGNQMFQYAAAFAWAKRTDRKLLLNQNSYLPKLFTLSATVIKPKETKSFLDNKQHTHCPIDRFKPDVLKQNCDILDGYFQNEKFFKEYAEDVRNEFTLKYTPTDTVKKIAAQMATENSICVHVRRGDYLRYGYPLPGQNYYHNAITYIQNKDSQPAHLYFFSNDMPWVKEHIKPKTPHTYIEGFADIEDMYLMSQCRHNVIANSSFSWWGAWLNKNPQKIVVAPDKWDEWSAQWAKDITPPEWISMPAHAMIGTQTQIVTVVPKEKMNSWPDFYHNSHRYLMPYAKKTYILFTDDTQTAVAKDVIKIIIPDLSDPSRGSVILNYIKNDIQKIGHLFFVPHTLRLNKKIQNELVDNNPQFIYASTAKTALFGGKTIDILKQLKADAIQKVIYDILFTKPNITRHQESLLTFLSTKNTQSATAKKSIDIQKEHTPDHIQIKNIIIRTQDNNKTESARLKILFNLPANSNNSRLLKFLKKAMKPYEIGI